MLYFIQTIFNKIIFIIILGLLFISFENFYAEDSWSDNEINQKVIQVKNESQKIKQEIRNKKTEVSKITQKENILINGIDNIEQNLDTLSKKLSFLQKKISDLEEKIIETSNAMSFATEQIKDKEAYASKRLIALYKALNIGEINLLLSLGSFYEICQRQNAIKSIFAYDEKVIENLIKNRKKLQELEEKLNKQKKDHVELKEDHNRQIILMSFEKEKRSKLLADIHNKKILKIEAIKSLEKAAVLLEQTIKSFNSEAGASQDQNFYPKFIIPVRGEIISFFGTYTNNNLNVQGFKNGINIKADKGEPIRAADKGKILYADWFKGYGNMIIIDHGNGFYTIYAHAEELFKARGDAVESGEVIATVGDTGFMPQSSLYFEIRHNGKPIDPVKWIKNG